MCAFNSLYGIENKRRLRRSRSAEIFQFPLWDTFIYSWRLNIYYYYFQFPLWDTYSFPAIASHITANFQFPLWDTSKSSNILTSAVPVLSIPFMGYQLNTAHTSGAVCFQFPLWDTCLLIFSSPHKNITFQFPLWDTGIQAINNSPRTYQTFNSLYGIQV